MKKALRANTADTDTDRLSDLPDVPLLHILSFLRSKEAVQTCILSKRWRNLWAYIRSVNFHYADFRNQEGENEEQKFLDFVNSFLILRKASNMDSFRLHWYHPETNPVIAGTWIRRAVECKPRLVDVYLCGLEPLEIPHSLFACTSIEVMVLGFCSHTKKTVIKPKSADLPRLRRLKVKCTGLGNDFVEKFAQGCPALEEMDALEEMKSKYEFLSGLCNATDVSFHECRGITQMRSLLAKELPKCPKFKNLRGLHLDGCLLYQDYNLIAWFIHLAPNLLKLRVTVKENFLYATEEELLKDKEVSKLEMPQKFPNCRQLKVKILYRRNERGAKELAKMLMENIKILRRSVFCVFSI